MTERTSASGMENNQTPWDIVYGATPLVESMGAQLYAAFGTLHQKLQAVAFGRETSPLRRKVAAQNIWGLQQADKLLALRQSYHEKDVPPHEIDRFRNLKVKQAATILRMQRKLLSAARALMSGQETTSPSDSQPDQSAY